MHELHHFARHIVELQQAGELPNDISKVEAEELRGLYGCYTDPGRESRDWIEQPWLTCSTDEFEAGLFEAYDYLLANFACPGIVVPESAEPSPSHEDPVDERAKRYAWLTPTERGILAVMDDEQPLSCRSIFERFCDAYNALNGAAAAANEVDGVEYGTVRNLVSSRNGDLQKYQFVGSARGKRGYIRQWRPPA